MKDRYDVICIGSGPGGYSAAVRLAKLGKSVAVIDYSKDKIGGVCLNEGCIPVKAIIKISKLYSELSRDGSRYGLGKDIAKADIKKIVAYSKNTSKTLKQGVLYLFNKNRIDFIEGEAKLLTNKKVEVKQKEGSTQTIEADNIILATGSKPIELPHLKFDKKKIISSSEAINLDRIPKSILIVGAGTIGVEFAGIFNNLGSKVALSEIKKQILPGEDNEISSNLESIFKRKGIDVYTGCQTEIINISQDSVKVNLKSPNTQEEIEVDMILVAAGRRPNIDEESFLNADIELDNGFVKVNDGMQTASSDIYAVGDITPYPMFAHSAYKESEIASLSIAGRNFRPINQLDIPRIVYSSIEAASIGLTEKEAQDKKLDIKVIKQYFRSNPRAVLSNYPDGFLKIIVDKNNHKLIGVHILGHEASELIHQFAISKVNDLTIDNIAEVIFGHPTFSEIIKEATSSILGRSVHT